MKNFVVGDIQGCYRGLKRALKKAKFDEKRDKLWAVGDLVARGPDSLSTLSYLHDLGPHFQTVLGNHDLHLIAVAFGIRQPKSQDKLEKLLKHKRFNSLIDWLIKQPLAVKPAKRTLITHAGLYPKFSIKQALSLSAEVEQLLQSQDCNKLIKHMYGNSPNKWSKQLKGMDRCRFIINAFTRMRFLENDKSLEFQHKSHPSSTRDDLNPWFMFDNKRLKPDSTLLFGHWASLLGKLPNKYPCPATIHALDSGFVWGNCMSVYCIETNKIIRVQA